MKRIHEPHVRGLWPSLAVILALAITVAPAMADDITWIGPTSGTQSFGVDDNWSAAVPGSTDTAIIDDALTGDRVIVTPAADTTIQKLHWTHQDVEFVNTLRLGGNLTINDGNNFSTTRVLLSNLTGDSQYMVLDLNGYTLSYGSYISGLPFQGPIKITTSGDPGMITLRDIRDVATGTYIDAGVTIKTTGGASSRNFGLLGGDGGIWHDNSTLWIAASSVDRIRGFPAAGIGNFIVGDPTFSAGTTVQLRSSDAGDGRFLFRGDVTINTSTNPADPSSLRFDSSIANVWVGGNYTDYADGDFDYVYSSGATGHIYFQGNPDTTRIVDIRRTGITATSFSVGVDADNVGDVRLAHQLTTGAAFTVNAGSKLDVADHLLTAGSFIQGDGVIDLAYRIGGASDGLISVVDLALGTFNVTIDAVEPLDGSEILLFTYSGDLTGTPTLGEVTGADGYSQLRLEDGQVWLAIPEPGSVALMSLGGLLLLARGRRRS